MLDDPSEAVSCRDCGSDDTATRWTGDACTMVVCWACGARWSPTPDSDDIHPLARLQAELDPHFGAGGMI